MHGGVWCYISGGVTSEHLWLCSTLYCMQVMVLLDSSPGDMGNPTPQNLQIIKIDDHSQAKIVAS